jgi:hypothetical protein
MRKLHSAVLALALLNVAVGIAAAQEPAAAATRPPADTTSSDRWSFIVEPYFMLPTMSGTSGVRGLEADVDASSGQILGALDFGAMLYLEMRRAEWAFSLDGMYMNLGASGSTKLGTVDMDLQQAGIMAAGYRRIKRWAEVMLGFQFNSLEGSFRGSGPLGVNLNDDKYWVDPYLGARWTLPRDKWRLGLLGAVGGFGIGSDFAWQVFPQLGYRFNSLFELNAGYRAIGMDYKEGSGGDEFLYDVVTYGPQVGARFHF